MSNLQVPVFTIIFILGYGGLVGQTASDLQKEQIRLQKKIQLTDQLIQTNKKDRKNSTTKLELLQTQIKSRKSLLNNYEKELGKIRTNHESLTKSVEILKKRRSELASNYSSLLKNTYRSKLTYNRWLFLLSAASFHQMLQRWRYLRHINKAWKKQLGTWHISNEKLDAELAELTQIEKDKTSKLVVIKKEASSLRKDRAVLDQTLAKLATDEKQLHKRLKQQKKSAKKLRKAIEDAVAKTTSNRKELPMTPAMKKLAKSFVDNKGSLPWPVEQGVIVRPFGTHAHPTLPNIKLKNNGLDIQTLPGSAIKTIFAGKVIAHQVIPGFDNMVIVAHGNYYSVYSHLAKVAVGIGDELSVGSTIGFAHLDVAKGEIHLEIWQGKTIMNPGAWLIKN